MEKKWPIIAPTFDEKAVGPAMGFNRALEGNAEVVGTVICGDNYFNENLDILFRFHIRELWIK